MIPAWLAAVAFGALTFSLYMALWVLFDLERERRRR